MRLSKKDLQNLSTEAINAAKKAGELISLYSNKNVNIEFKGTVAKTDKKPVGGNSLASQVVTEVDLKSQEIILAHLKPSILQFDLGLLTEELADDKSRFEKDYFWCIDPLDGTLPFTEGKPGYSVSIALVSKAGIPLIGVIYDPVKDNLYWTYKGGGFYKNDELFSLPTMSNHLYFIMDRSFVKDPAFNQINSRLKNYAQKNNFTQIAEINNGGAAMNAIWVLENNPACYFKFPKTQAGGGSLWDFAASAAIFNELNIPVSDIHGQALNLNLADSTFMNRKGVLFASNKSLCQEIKNIYKMSNSKE